MAHDPRVGTRLGNYRIDAQIGRGGMGVVYVAEQLGLGRRVAIKLIMPELAQDPGFRGRFQQESRLAASIDHPNVIPIYEAGEADGLLYISMRYVEGTDLRALIRRDGRIAPQRAASLVGQVASALDAAHAHGLVHRDVKPANVLIAGAPPGEHAYLTDFGLVKQVGASGGPTSTGQWVGTLDYVAPEQIEGRRVDARSDVYALGCVLHQTLTGSVPFPRDSDVAKMYAHLHEPPPSCGAAVPGIPSALDEVVRRAMAKRPDERFPSAGDLGRAVRAAAAGAAVAEPERSVAAGPAAPGGPGGAPTVPLAAPSPPLPPAPPPAWERTPATAQLPPARRSPWPAIAAVALVVLALGGAAAALVASGALSEDDDSGGADTVTVGDENTGSERTEPERTDGEDPPPDTEPFSSAAFTAEYPAGWRVVQEDEPQTTFNRTRFESGEQFVVIDRSPGKGSVDPADAAREVRDATSGTAGYEEISFEPTTIAGRDAYEWAFMLDGDRRVDYFLSLGGDGYAVYGGEGEDFDSVLEATRGVAESIEPR